MARRVRAWHGSHGKAGLVTAGPGQARRGLAGTAGQRVAGFVWFRLGRAWQATHFKRLRPGAGNTGPWGESTLNQERG